jgi:sigma-B regulation protein RsbU (phosphoserine phosphatase)
MGHFPLSMGFNLEETLEALLAPDENGEPKRLDRAGLESALQGAFKAGKKEFKEQLAQEPPLEVHFFQELMQSLPDYVYFKDTESRIIISNPAHAAHLGLPIEEVVGKTDHDFFEPANAQRKREDELQIMRLGKGFDAPRLDRIRFAGEADRWSLSSKHPWYHPDGSLGGTFGISRDVTAEIQAERALAEQHRLIQTLVNILPCRIFIRDREHRFRLINNEYRRFFGYKRDEEIIGKRFGDLVEHGRLSTIEDEDETIMRTGVPVISRSEFDSSPVAQGRWLSISKVPLRSREGTIEGIVGVAFDISAQKQTEAEARSARRRLAISNEQIETELALARRLQIAFATFRFPEILPLANGFQVDSAYLYEPCEHLGGDFFQLIQVSPHVVATFVCDVMGHGVRSALVTALLRGLIEEKRAILTRPDQLFTQINSILNRLAQDPDFPRFVSATLAVFDTQSGTVQLVNAGHTPILCCPTHASSGQIESLPARRNPALGLLPDIQYRIAEVPLRSDCSYILYTNGLLEEANGDHLEFGLEGLNEALANAATIEPKGLIAELHKHLTAHIGKPFFSDDICVMALSFRPSNRNGHPPSID